MFHTQGMTLHYISLHDTTLHYATTCQDKQSCMTLRHIKVHCIVVKIYIASYWNIYIYMYIFCCIAFISGCVTLYTHISEDTLATSKDIPFESTWHAWMVCQCQMAHLRSKLLVSSGFFSGFGRGVVFGPCEVQKPCCHVCSAFEWCFLQRCHCPMNNDSRLSWLRNFHNVKGAVTIHMLFWAGLAILLFQQSDHGRKDRKSVV